MPACYIGLMSGTSVDGIDAVVVDFDASPPALLAARTLPWPEALRSRITRIIEDRNTSLEALGRLDADIGTQLARAVQQVLEQAALDPARVRAIGSHGQTLFHAPDGEAGFSMQAGDPNRIAEQTGITTVADFRRRDIAAGGQGAPLVPAFHQALFHQPGETRVVLNIGGMANVTLLPGDATEVTGFDTGPGNILLDGWYRRHRDGDFDRDGDWGAGGTLQPTLLDALRSHPWLEQPPPKSTGRETFCLQWLDELLEQTDHRDIPPRDVQRTLAEFTATTIQDALERYAAGSERILVCGGGVHNRLLMQRLVENLAPRTIESTESHGLHPDWVEAVAFAWLAKQTLEGRPGNLPAVTGARGPRVLGAICPGS